MPRLNNLYFSNIIQTDEEIRASFLGTRILSGDKSSRKVDWAGLCLVMVWECAYKRLYLTITQNYDGPLSKLKAAYRLWCSLTAAEIENLGKVQAATPIDQEDLWSQSKLTATMFLNADKRIRLAAVEQNRLGNIAGETEMNSYCVARTVKQYIDAIVADKDVPEFAVTEDMIDLVCRHFSIDPNLQ